MKTIKTYSQFLNESTKHKFYTTKEEIKEWLEHMMIENYRINKDLTVDVLGNVTMNSRELTHIPVQFRKVNGTFNVENNKLRNLVGSPIEVGGSFYCKENYLTSLKGCPEIIKGNFDCNLNKLKNLVGGPRVVKGKFYECEYNPLETLEGFPEVVDKFYCRGSHLRTFVYLNTQYPMIQDLKDKRVEEIYANGEIPIEVCHAESLLLWLSEEPSKAKSFIKRLKIKSPDEYNTIMGVSKQLRIEMGLESKEITYAYNISKDVEGDFY